MEQKLFDSELRVMEHLWRDGDLTAGVLAKRLAEEIGWNRNTTYTVIKKLVNKGAVERLEPNFLCHALISKEEVQQQEAVSLMDKLFDGSPSLLVSAFLGEQKALPPEESLGSEDHDRPKEGEEWELSAKIGSTLTGTALSAPTP